MPLGWTIRAMSVLVAAMDAASGCDLCAVAGAAEVETAMPRSTRGLPAWQSLYASGVSGAASRGPSVTSASSEGTDSGSIVRDSGDTGRNGAGGDDPRGLPPPFPAAPTPSRFRLGANLGLMEEYTSSESARSGSHSIADPDGQFLHSSSTQAFIGVSCGRLGLRAYVPYEYRQFRRAIPLGIETGWLYGPGDTAIEATLLAVRHVGPGSTALLTGIVGVKLPTGDSSILDQEEDTNQGQTTSGGHVHGSTGINKMKILIGVNPVFAKNPVSGVFDFTHQGQLHTFSVTMSDQPAIITVRRAAGSPGETDSKVR